ncbi:MAG TPA: hypothetical protein VMP01_06830 [Pirellulaceae bacterium]|nr:hypothetical protein [Pirellulaceae bacterium]
MFQAIDQAMAIRDAGGLEFNILEARILAKESATEIADRHSLLPLAVQAYERLLFRIDHAREALDWICIRAIRYSEFSLRAPCIGPVLRKYGFFAGPVALERMIETVHQLIGGSLIDDLQFIPGSVNLEELALRRTLAFELMRPTRQNLRLILQMAHEYRRPAATAESSDEQPAETSADWRALAAEFTHRVSFPHYVASVAKESMAVA